MSNVKVKWTGGRQFIGTDSHRHALVMDVSEDGGGEDSGFRPSELLMIALAGCTGIDVISILHKARQDVYGLEIRVSGQQASDYPRAFEQFQVEYVVRGRNVKDEIVRRAIELSEEKYCSVGATVRDRATIVSSYRIEPIETSASSLT